MLQPSRPRAAKAGRGPLQRVYFIEAVGFDMVKIGFARDIRERIRQLKAGCPAPLRLLGTLPGGLEIERHYHERLAACRVHGEWFRRCHALDAIVDGIDKPSSPSAGQASQAEMAQRTREYEERCARLSKQWADERRLKEEAQEARRRERMAAKVAARSSETAAEQIAARL